MLAFLDPDDIIQGHGEPFPYEEKGVTMVTQTAQPLAVRQKELMNKYRHRYSDYAPIRQAQTATAMLAAFEQYRKALIADANKKLEELRRNRLLSSSDQHKQMQEVRRKLTDKLEKLCAARDNLRLTL